MSGWWTRDASAAETWPHRSAGRRRRRRKRGRRGEKEEEEEEEEEERRRRRRKRGGVSYVRSFSQGGGGRGECNFSPGTLSLSVLFCH